MNTIYVNSFLHATTSIVYISFEGIFAIIETNIFSKFKKKCVAYKTAMCKRCHTYHIISEGQYHRLTMKILNSV